MARTTIRLALAGALSVGLSAGGTLLAARAVQQAPARTAMQPVSIDPVSIDPVSINTVSTGTVSIDPVAIDPGARLTLLLELQEDPGAIAYAAALERGPARSAQTLAAAAAAGRRQLTAVAAEQQRVGAALAAPAISARELFRVQRSLNAIAVTVDRATVPALRRVPGVKAVRPLDLEYPTNSSSVPFIGAPAVWDGTAAPGLNVTGSGIRIGIIDTGVDYQHPTFGGTGTLADYQANDRSAAPDSFFPSAKVVGGWDFVGDAYTGSTTAVPDADPMDCNGHGTHVAGSAAGFGVKSDGTTFTGPFGTATPFSSLRIGPGTAPQAQLYALRVFGCGGGTNRTVQAIDWAMDPNGDDDFSDRLDVINMSLGSNFGGLTSSTAIAADNAARAGVIVVTSAGNSGDTYFISGSPGSADRAIATAASIDDGLSGAGLTVNSPASIAGSYVADIANFGGSPPAGGVTGSVVIALDPSDSAGPDTLDGCSPLTNAAAIAGHIALIERGTCGFPDKVKHAQEAGAIAAIIANGPGGTAGNMAGFDPTITIPSVMVSFEVADMLKSNLATLNVTLFNGGDTLTSFSSRGPRGGATRIALKPDIAAPGYQIVSAQTGITCTGSAGSTGCQTPTAGGVIADGQPLRLNGTSMAAPHVAGIMALLRQLHPDWSVEELKALVMNRALHDVTVLPSTPSGRYGLGRIGAGRVDAALAAQSSVVAFNADEPGVVSLSFEGEVLGTASRQKKLRLVNHGTTSQTYDLGIDVVVDAPGVAFSTPGGSSVTVPAGQSVELTVQMDADASQMDHARDSSVSATQTPATLSSLGPLPRHWLTEEAAYLTLGQSGSTRIRVPLYTAPAPMADMQAPSIVTGGSPTGSTTIPLSGRDVCTGTLGAGPTCTGSFPTDVVSIVQPFELHVASPQNPAAAPPEADLQYVGVSYSNFMDEISFGVSTWGPWKTPNDVTFNIFIDCGVYTLVGNFSSDTCTGAPDGIYDLILFNTNPGSLSTLGGVTGVNPQDSFITAVLSIARSTVAFQGPTYLNGVSSALGDTRLFDNQVMLLSAARSRLKIAGTFNYRVETCPGSQPLCQFQGGFHYDEAAGPYRWDYQNRGLSFGDTRLFADLNGAALPVTWNVANMGSSNALGALLLHHHNGEGKRAEVVLLDTVSQADLGLTLTASTTTPTVGQDVTFTLTLTNNGPNAAQDPRVQFDLPMTMTPVSHTGGGAYDHGLGLWNVAGALPNGESRSLQIVARADTAASVNARATVFAASPRDPNSANDLSILGVMAPQLSDLQITIAAPTPTATYVGTPASFTVTVRNAGADPAYNVLIANTFTVGSGTIQSGTASAGLFDAGTGAWRLASLAPGAQQTLTLSVLPLLAPSLTLQAQANTSSQDASLANNTGTSTLTALPRQTMLTMSIVPGTALVDEARTLRVTLTDIAAGTAANPLGTVTLASAEPDVTISGACVLTATPLSASESSCEVTVSASLAGTKSIAASYPAGNVHASFSGDTDLIVETRPTTITTAADPTTVMEDDADQAVQLTATVSSSLPVDAGIVTFTVRDAANAIVGVPVASAPLTNGAASATYTLPGGTAAQTLHITAAFADGTRFGASSDATTTLTVSAIPSRIYTLAEGATGGFFATRILLANPNDAPAPVTLTFATDAGTTASDTRTLAPMSRSTVVVSEIAGLASAAMSTTVTSTAGLPLVVERTMQWDATGYGAHTEKAEEGGSTSWYFAEGAQGFFSTFLLLANPQASANTAHVTYYREGLPPLTRDYPVPAGVRHTVDLRGEPALAASAFGMRVQFDQPGFAERATYFGTTPIWTGGTASSGAKALSQTWLFAEGATGSFFSTFLLIANPHDEAANVTVTYLPAGGAPVAKVYPLAGGRRLTLNIADEDPSLAAGAVGSRVESDRPIVAERAQYWPRPDWIEGHSSLGLTAAGRRWGLAEGTVGGAQAAQTYILLVNPGAAAAEVTVTFLRATGSPLVKPFTVAPHERRNIWIGGAGTDVPELTDEGFGALLESTQPIVVERSIYGNANGVIWASGTNATATALPLVP